MAFTNIVLDTNIIISYPKLLGLKMKDVSFVVPLSVISELNERANSRGKSFDDRVDLIEQGEADGTLTILNTDLPGYQKYLTGVDSLRLSEADQAIVAAAMYLSEHTGEETVLATRDKEVESLAQKNGIKTLSDSEIRDLIASFNDPKPRSFLSQVWDVFWEAFKISINEFYPADELFKLLKQATTIEGQIVLFEKKETANFVSGILIGALLTLMLVGAYMNLDKITATINVWGTILMILLMGIGLFIIREKRRLDYGVAEFLVGIISIVMLFKEAAFDYAKIDFSMAFNLKISAGLYIMVRGQDNIVKAIKDSKIGLKLKSYGIGN